MVLKGKIFKFMSDILKDGSYYKLYTQAKSTLVCGLPKGFLLLVDCCKIIIIIVIMIDIFCVSSKGLTSHADSQPLWLSW